MSGESNQLTGEALTSELSELRDLRGKTVVKLDILNLTEGFEPYGEGSIDFKSFVFPGGELQVKVGRPITGRVLITSRMRGSEDVLRLLLVADALRRRSPKVELYAFIPYLPYARQDRVCAPGEALSLSVAADIINNMKLDRVIVFDPHSDVSAALIDRLLAIDNTDFVSGIVSWFDRANGDIFLVAPDAGASKKIYGVAKRARAQVLIGSKSRDVNTGEITGTSIHGDVKPNRPHIVVDDICDGGRTFIELAKVLEERGVTRQWRHLIVSHGIFSQGRSLLLDYYNTVHCTESFGEGTPFKDFLPLNQLEARL
jgi:ribose-phosphate pyrophosphokinase